MKPRSAAGILALALAMLGAGLYLATPFAAAGHRVEIDARRTLSCATALGALQIGAFASNPSVGSADTTISTGDPSSTSDPNRFITLLQVNSKGLHYGVAADRCHSVTKHVVLSHRGLKSAGVTHAGEYRSPKVYCAATRRVLIRFLITYGASGKPTAATVEVLTLPKARSATSKPLGYVEWSPKRSVLYYSPSACTT